MCKIVVPLILGLFPFLLSTSVAKAEDKASKTQATLDFITYFEASPQSADFGLSEQRELAKTLQAAWDQGFIPTLVLEPKPSEYSYHFRDGRSLKPQINASKIKIQIQTSEWGHDPIELFLKTYWQRLTEAANLQRVTLKLIPTIKPPSESTQLWVKALRERFPTAARHCEQSLN